MINIKPKRFETWTSAVNRYQRGKERKEYIIDSIVICGIVLAILLVSGVGEVIL